MGNKPYTDIMEGKKDSNIHFSDLRRVLESKSFVCRIKGDHFIYTHTEVSEIVNIQPKGNMAKPYQVKQVRQLFQKYCF